MKNTFIKIQSYSLPSSTTLTKAMLSHYINTFWDDIFCTEELINNHLLILVKVTFTNGGVRTLAQLRKVNFTDKVLFIEYIYNRLNILADSYRVDPICEINFNYIVRDGQADDSRSLLQSNDYEVTSHVFNSMKIPATMNLSEYGETYIQQEIDGVTKSVISDNSRSYHVESNGNENKVHIPKPVDLKWTDTKLTDSMFKREICLRRRILST